MSLSCFPVRTETESAAVTQPDLLLEAHRRVTFFAIGRLIQTCQDFPQLKLRGSINTRSETHRATLSLGLSPPESTGAFHEWRRAD